MLLISSIAVNYGLSLLGKEPVSETDSNSKVDESCPTSVIAWRIISLFNIAFISLCASIKFMLTGKSNHENEIITLDKMTMNAKKRALIISSMWMILIAEIITCYSQEIYVQAKFDIVIIASVFIVLIIAIAQFISLRRCPTIYVALAIISCIIWLGSLVYISSKLYIRNYFDIDSAIYFAIHVLPSLIFLPILTYYYYAWELYKSHKKMDRNSGSGTEP